MIRGRKRKTPPKPIDLFAGAPKNQPNLSSIAINGSKVSSLQDTLPPLPAVPNIVSPTRLNSPHDTTQIIMNGKVVQLDRDIDSRINGEEKIKPLTPPNVNIFEHKPIIIQNELSPNRYTDSNVRIMETPKKETEEESKNDDNHSQNDSPSSIPEFYEPAPEIKIEPPIIPPLPEIKPILKQKDNYPSEKLKVQNQGKNMKSLLPTFKPKININIENTDKEQTEEIKPQAFSPVNIPYPIFESSVRAISPIQTIGPKSPGLNVKPIFTEEGKSSTPKITTPAKPSSVRALTPPPLFRSPKKVMEEERATPVHIATNNQNVDNDISEAEFRNLYNQYKNYHHSSTPIAPEQTYSYHQEQQKVSNRPNYSRVSREQEIYLRQEFKVKFGILRSTYPQWNVVEPDDSLSLDQIHDLYDHYLKQILISRESGSYKTYMVIFLMVIEVIGVRFLKLNMSGYTLSQLRIMNRYDALFTELGEKYLISGGSNWPVEARIVMMMLFNAVIFLVVRYLCTWMGMEGIADTLQGMIDNMLNGPSMITQNSGPIGSANPIPDPVGLTAPPTSTTDSGGSNTIDKIADMFGNFMNKNSGGITEKIAEIGTLFTKKTQNNNNAQAKVQEKKKPVEADKKRKINKKKLFDD